MGNRNCRIKYVWSRRANNIINVGNFIFKVFLVWNEIKIITYNKSYPIRTAHLSWSEI